MNSGGALIRTRTRIVPVTLTCFTDGLAAGEIIADTQLVANAFPDVDCAGILQSLTIYDVDDLTAYDFEVFIHRTSTSLGTEGAAISMSDANVVLAELKVITFDATDDVTDLINGKMYQKTNLGIPIRSVVSTADLYISAVCLSGTPDHTAAGLIAVLGILPD